MRPIPWRSILYFVTFIFFALSVGLWGYTYWNRTEPWSSTWNGYAIAAASLLLGFLTYYAGSRASDTPVEYTRDHHPTSTQRERNRQAMLGLVRNTWVKGVLENSLHGAVLIELGMEERKEAVEHPWEVVVQTPNRPNRQLPRGTKMIDLFNEMGRSLLILGEPGSGKTTMLLELARDAIARTEQDPAHPIPVVFNLSSWADCKQPIAE